jgi:hypothetical protein
MVAMDLNALNFTGFLQSNQNTPDMTRRCFYAFGYVSLSSELMNLKIAQHPIAKRSSGELMHSWASRGTPTAWRMFGIGNSPKKDAVEGVNFIGHHLLEIDAAALAHPFKYRVLSPYASTLHATQIRSNIRDWGSE